MRTARCAEASLREVRTGASELSSLREE